MSALSCLNAAAQTDNQFSPISPTESPSVAVEMQAQPIDTPTAPIDTLSLPTLDMHGHPMIGGSWRMWGWGSMGYWMPWHVHEGLNLSLGASVFSTFGSGHTWSGAGFTQDVSAIYATRLNKRLSLAVGGYFNNMIWAHNTYRDAGFTATLGYDFNDKLTGYIYAQKSLVNNRPLPFYAYDMGNMGDRIGVALEYKITPAFTIGASFEVNRTNYDYAPADWTAPGIPKQNPNQLRKDIPLTP